MERKEFLGILSDISDNLWAMSSRHVASESKDEMLIGIAIRSVSMAIADAIDEIGDCEGEA